MKIATLQNDKGKWKVVDPREGKGVSSFDKVEQAVDLFNAVNAEIAAESVAVAAAAGPNISVSNGKAILGLPGLGFKGMVFSGYVADWDGMFTAFGTPPDAPIRAAIDAVRPKLVETWQAYRAIPVGATLPDGSTKQAPRAKA